MILLSVNLNLIAFSSLQRRYRGQIFAMLVLTVAAAEAASLGHHRRLFSAIAGDFAVENVDL